MRIDPSIHPTHSNPTKNPSLAGRPFVEVLREQQSTPPKIQENGPGTVTGAAPTVSPGQETVKKILNQAVNTENNMDQRLREITSGKIFSPSELIALQAEVFRYSQSVEVVSRVTDKVVGGLKQILSTQV
jgi:hypothetical protein